MVTLRRWGRQPVMVLGLLGLATRFVHADESAVALDHRKRWDDPSYMKRVQENVEKYRKGDAVIELVDAAGKPVSGAQVEARQTLHHFLFGCNAFVLGQLKTPEANQQFEESFVRLFNQATVPFYWEGTEPSKGVLCYEEGGRYIWRRPPTDRFLPWGAKHQLTLKAHPLLWHTHNPSWLPKDAEELHELYRKRFREIATRYGEKIPIFEVVNESLTCSKAYPLHTPDLAYVAWAFREVEPLFPKSCSLMINEITIFNFIAAPHNAYVKHVKALLADNVRIDGIGLQFHFFRRTALDKHMAGPNDDPVKLLDLYQKFAEFPVPLYITEITIPSAGPDGEKLQADLVRDHYRLWFSAPTMAGITWWNLGDKTAISSEIEAEGGLMDSDMQPKAAYRVLDELINKEWRTNVTAVSDATGTVSFRGFHGTYEVRVTRNGATQTVPLVLAPQGEGTHKVVFKD